MLTFFYWILLALAWYLMLFKPFRNARSVAWLVLALALVFYGLLALER